MPKTFIQPPSSHVIHIGFPWILRGEKGSQGLRKDGSGGELQHDVVLRANLHHDAARDQNAEEGPGGFGVRDGGPLVTGPGTSQTADPMN